MTPVEWGMLITLSILWGGAFFFNSIAVKELPTLIVVVCRVGIGALILNIVIRLMGVRLPGSKKIWIAFFVMGILNNLIPFSLIVWGQSYVASSVASIINATTPMFTVIVAHLLTRDERMSAGRVFGVIIGFAGVAVMIGGGIFAAMGDNVIAQFAFLGAGLSYAFAGVFGRRFSEMGITPMATATGQVTASAIVLLPIALVVEQPWNMALPSMPVIGAVIGIAGLSTALAYILYFRILATAGATNISIVTFLVPVSAILLGVLILDEILHLKHLYGMVLIAIGLAAIDGRPFKYLKRIWS